MKWFKFYIWSVIFLVVSTQGALSQTATSEVENYTLIDTTKHQVLPSLMVYPKPEFKSKRMERKYWKLVRDVKKTLPYAKGISQLVHSLEDTLTTFENNREKRKFLKTQEKALFADYEKPLKSLTYSQGKLLIKLVDRECSETTFELVQLYRGKLTAFFWQSFAVIFGMNLKNEFDEADEDLMIEHVIHMVENGYL